MNKVDPLHDAQFAITIFITLLIIASGVAMLTKWIRVPYTVALVMVGLAISPMHFLPPVHISPELILLIFLPALLFEAAWNLKLNELRANLIPIIALATAGVFMSVGVIGSIIHFGVGLPWAASLLFGAIISATDPVSVLALFKKLGAPERLTVIIEGESLLNDGTAAVVFRILTGIVVGTTATSSMGGLVLNSLITFVVVVAGGVVVGLIVGFVVSKITSHFDDHLLEITLTTVAAYGSFLLAETLHVSPVIAVLVAGIIIGNYGWNVGMSENTQVAVDSFWEYAAFVVNSLVFLLIGLEIPLSMLANHVKHIAWALIGLITARAVVIYFLLFLSNRVTQPISAAWQHILFWGGLRGSLSVALVLSLPLELKDRQSMVAMTFGTVVFSLLFQGLTIAPLLSWLKIDRKASTPG